MKTGGRIKKMLVRNISKERKEDGIEERGNRRHYNGGEKDSKKSFGEKWAG